VSFPVASLTPGTTYHYQLVAKNSAGTTPGVDRTFTTSSPPAAPGASTGLATVQGETEATLQGTVDPNGEATTYLFEWGTSDQYGQSTAELPAGEDHLGHSESARLTGLAPGTVYHFRVLAKNGLGTTPGGDEVFTTASPPPPVSPPPPTPSPSSPSTGPTATQSAAPSPPLVEPPFGSPIAGAVALRDSQHGASVGGSLEVSAAGAGGRLEIDLLAKGASLARAKRSAAVLVGRLVRGSLSAGRVSFVVKLDAKARASLRRHRRLALTVRIVLTPKQGQAVTVTHGVVLGR
jgi:6,7-dimethyl-8-ribityllumazine synthase